jgi:hypothetical protein
VDARPDTCLDVKLVCRGTCSVWYRHLLRGLMQLLGPWSERIFMISLLGPEHVNVYLILQWVDDVFYIS